MRRTSVLMVLLISPAAVAQQSVFELKTWPGEGIPVLIAKQSRLDLHSSPDLRSAPIRVTYGVGWRIPFDDTLIRTLQGAEVKTIGAGSLEVWCEGRREQLTVSAGESWTYLQYASEGFVTARIQNRICQLPAYTEEAMFGEDLPQPEVQWWVKVKYADGSSPGWLLVTDEQVLYGPRQF